MTDKAIEAAKVAARNFLLREHPDGMSVDEFWEKIRIDPSSAAKQVVKAAHIFMQVAVDVIEAYEKALWVPIEELKLEQYPGYSVSKPVVVLLNYPETGQNFIEVTRVWEENSKRELADLKYTEYRRATHFRPLPTPPEE